MVGTSAAVGGNGGGIPELTFSEGTGGDGGTAHAQIDLTSAGSVSATVSVTGGNGGGASEGPMVGKGLMYLLIPVPSMPPLRPGILFSSMLRRGAEMEVAPGRVFRDKAVTPRFP